ncbi:MAG: bifunctional phosphopantothenoylcysteine decarboxylase/phosphopantothenate--cysteine ligase CoaBC [Fluviicoccus sp.]|uniref:bifunctional phosphopantothenoylcysteine decarboxylase/phosphopantothenate--cysteine ligase CoaBC n=1 Tax=Fluviicoccus sp. TaxID=2003552 RepID=UPI002726DD25|nr:bifunctional phosphopantothenoylcysteine decarboxylase/phosphopantothenate--cysteine ligase CoaBC [Fluviicoccus sp.]MDO8330345.1 bifunctional phosphopantothenoylcysteine decarboxylase/phosphopantothenate--cysteine ligase CoaBC [Fluviicoccus sp.]
MLVNLSNKRILLGISGGIAAYKSADLVRRLRDAGAEVRVVMTAAACQFITPLTLQALSGHPVHTELLDPEAEAGMGHIELARWADLVLVAPASADVIARLAAGLANDLLTTLWLACPGIKVIAPAMNQQMWVSSPTRENVECLLGRGVVVLGPASGSQACGDVGAGRMLEAVELARHCAGLFATGSLAGRRVVITAGPTREPIDPVRYVSNHSSGKMGYALAQACVEAGARVTLISGPVHLPTPERVQRINVGSALEMLSVAESAVSDGCDIFIATAAVADYRPVSVAEHKIKKTGDALTIELVRNPDIVATVASRPDRPFVVGFAAETRQVEEYAKGKLRDKRLDMIACNDVSRADIGFQSDDNAMVVFWDGGSQRLDKAPKTLIARELVSLIARQINPSL